jgi:hypothetical protein
VRRLPKGGLRLCAPSTDVERYPSPSLVHVEYDDMKKFKI